MSPPPIRFLRARLVGRPGLFTIDVGGGRISTITSNPATDGAPGETVDLRGEHWIGPGLSDAHVHFSTWALAESRLDLSQARSAEQTREIVRKRAEVGGTGEVIVGANFRVGSWPDISSMTKEFLDEAVPDRPVALISGDLHFMWLSTRGLEHLGIDPKGHEGVLREKPAFDAMMKLSQVPEAELDEAVYAAAKKAAQKGVTNIVEFEMTHNIPTWLRRVQKNGFRRLRVHLGMYQEHIQDAISLGLKSGDEVPGSKGLLTVGPYKIITDGSLGARTAYCHDPYPDTADHGLWIYPTTTLRSMANYGTQHSLTLAIHAIGDLANDLVLETFASLSPPPLPGSSIEHAQLLTTPSFPLFAALSLIASVQPEHLLDDQELVARFWPGREGRAFAFHDLEKAGARIRLGSDAPVAALDPWGSMAAAVSRERKGEEGKEGASWHPEQRLSNEAAWEASTGSGKRSIEVGDVADLCVLKGDPLAASAKELRAMEVVGTVLGGEWTHRTEAI